MRSLAVLVALCATPLAAQTPHAAAAAFDPERLARIATVVQSDVTAGNYAGASFLVLHRGEEVAHGCFGKADVAADRPLQRDSICRIYSMTKAITAVAALTLVEADALRLDARIGRWLPEFAAPRVLVGGTAEAPELVAAERAITVRMLLNHTAGFSYDFFRDSPVDELYRRTDLWGAASMDEFVRRAAALPLLAQPGERYRYSIADDVLGALIERVSGQPLADYVREHVTGPLGMDDTDYDVPEAKRDRLATLHTRKDGRFEALQPSFGAFAEAGRGFAAGGAGMFSTLDDYAKFCSMLLGNGSHRGVRILSRKTMELAATDSLRHGQDTGSPGDGWGLVCGIRTDPGAAADLGSTGMLFWSGAATTAFFVDPSEGLVGVLFCQHLPHDPQRLIPRFRDAVFTALR